MPAKIILGRASNNLTAGIVGLANIGKSTFFQAITNSKLSNPANYPFATINPEECKIQIPNDKLDHLQKLYESKKQTRSILTIFDIAGLIRGASQGNGLGNKFLNDIKPVDGIFHLVRGFAKEDVAHVEGSVNPTRDLSIVQDELILKDLEYLENAIEKLKKKISINKKSSLDYQNSNIEMDLLQRIEEHLYNGRKIIHFKKDWTQNEVDILNRYHFLTAKPTLILLNVSPKDYALQKIKNNKYLKDMKEWVEEYSPGDKIVTMSANFETEFNKYKNGNDSDGWKQYCQTLLDGETGVKETDLQLQSIMPTLIQNMRQLLDLISFFTCGPQEVREWNIREGLTAQEAAGVIHTDLQETFISADIIKYSDIKDMNPPLLESILKQKSLVKKVGKQYIMHNNDIALFKAVKGKTR
ncbi:hypothetical protein NCAS_0A12600 [Naumovozyma castellii]|uniref:Obg-like ATPase homolog n=1 Tax=Naumovozyma castellii TaxID=27288 RepID=G0V8L9_NAUCA|nr:hypothetical protein NCAS_0A12600 [Naumovozyma castellii CBS 4309]CCC67818.1 hypothetical protein NCAS_0A12600 [Naumovozyma castellii CBS 4309]